MSEFVMCERCEGQYKDVLNRRFHAQPVACGACGPEIWLADEGGKQIERGTDEVLAKAAGMLKEGKIAAIKGLGGFHLAVDALNDEAVKRLRQRKKRDRKPFAMMAAGIEQVRRYAVVGEQEESLLKSVQCPIVLVEKKEGAQIARSVAAGTATFGFMLCYTPLHHLLFGEGLEVLVMSSGNISDEPLVYENAEAVDRLGDIADFFLMHNRKIYRPVDDSIVQVIDGEPALLRRARGYVPTPIIINKSGEANVLAAGSDMKNTFCFVRGDEFICSEHIGDLEDGGVYRRYVSSIDGLGRLVEVRPEVVVCDLHPGYVSTGYAKSLEGVRLVQVQHHWAHIASVLAEHGVRGPAIGLECDGTGLGTDGAIWGCECLIADFDGFERFGHLAYYPLAGGDKASREAIRCVLGLLRATYGDEFELENFAWLLERIEEDQSKQRVILEQIDKGVNTFETSSLGRLFDAVSALSGIGSYNHFEAELPMGLESAVERGVEGGYDYSLEVGCGEPLRLNYRIIMRQIVDDVKKGVRTGLIAARFHNCICNALLEMAGRARKARKINIVALSGGVFCNRYFSNRLIRLLKREDFEVLFNRRVPCNDGGISLGQAAIGSLGKTGGNLHGR